MSGHSKWANIKHRKGAKDAKRAKIFTKLAKEIENHASRGSDPSMNPALKLAIDKAKISGVTNDLIDRAIKRGSGASKDLAIMDESIYEGYAPGGIALIIESLTDNKNRTAANIRAILSKNGGSLGATGSVMFNFEHKGHCLVSLNSKDPDEVTLQLIDFGADNISTQDDALGDTLDVTTSRENLISFVNQATQAGFIVQNAELTYIPKETITINDPDTAQKVMDLIEILEDDDDVIRISSNMEVSDEILSKLAS